MKTLMAGYVGHKYSCWKSHRVPQSQCFKNDNFGKKSKDLFIFLNIIILVL